MIPLKELKRNPKNRNKHPKDQIDRLIKLIEYQGFRNPIVVSSLSGMIVAGDGRYQAAKKMKLKEVPVIVQDFKDDDQELAYQISDNAVSEWSELDFSGINEDVGTFDPSFDLELLGIHNFTIDVADKEELTDPDSIPEKVEPKAKLGDIYQLGSHRLMCGDSVSIQNVEILLDGAKPEIAYIDPPYGINLLSKEAKLGKSSKYRPIIGDENTQIAKDSFGICAALDIPVMIFWGANHYSASLPDSSCWVVWDKQGGKSVTFADCELAWTNLKMPVRLFQHIWDGFRRDSEKGNKRVHPTQKPVALAESVFTLCESNGFVLDLFGGSGSTLIACEKTNRKCFMMELDPHYVSIIIARWEKYTGQEARLING